MTLDAKKMLSYKIKGKKSDKNNGLLHLKVTCGARTSSAVTLDLRKVSGSKRTRNEAAALKSLAKLLKAR